MSGNPLYATPEWKATRLLVLERDGYVCQIRGRRCTHTATEADHIIEVSIRPDLALALDNLRAACKPCNSSRGATHGNRLRLGAPSRVW